MEKMSLYFFTAAFPSLAVGTLFYLWYVFKRNEKTGKYATLINRMGAFFLTMSLLFRSIAAGRGPFSNQYEFTLAFAWEVLSAQGLVYVVILGVVFVGFVVLMYRYIERQKNIFFGLKQALE